MPAGKQKPDCRIHRCLALMMFSMSASLTEIAASVRLLLQGRPCRFPACRLSQWLGDCLSRLNFAGRSTRSGNKPARREIIPEHRFHRSVSPIVQHLRSRLGINFDALDRPAAARIPCPIPPPSNAGPAEQAHVSRKSRLPTTNSPFVPFHKKAHGAGIPVNPAQSNPAVMSPDITPDSRTEEKPDCAWIWMPTSPAVYREASSSVGVYGASLMCSGRVPEADASSSCCRRSPRR